MFSRLRELTFENLTGHSDFMTTDLLCLAGISRQRNENYSLEGMKTLFNERSSAHFTISRDNWSLDGRVDVWTSRAARPYLLGYPPGSSWRSVAKVVWPEVRLSRGRTAQRKKSVRFRNR